tara:strand:+ start:16985 stop:18274 length:1290 start_codon:yes stop_codon:yes gene_type:complete
MPKKLETPTNRPPSIDQIARAISDLDLPHPLLVDAAREAVNNFNGDDVIEEARKIGEVISRTLLTDVINATGVLLHTNMGRAPIKIGDKNKHFRFSNLEFDLETGERGSRQDRSSKLIARACGAESALIVNNCASAVLLVIAALAEGRGVAVSRSELVEIGGGFRIPEILQQSGAHLVEVGTTNRTRRKDFEKAINKNDVSLVLKVHQSNYRIVGFTETTDISEMADLGIPLVVDIGSGLIDSACPWLENGPPKWLIGEPAARQSLESGAEIVTFSGDKLFGGPQAGIIAGKTELVELCAQHPLARAVRPGSLTMSALQEITISYLERKGSSIPFWKMSTTSVDELKGRADKISAKFTTETNATPGGGTLPGVEIPSAGLKLAGDHVEFFRQQNPPIICRMDNDQTVIDLMTVHPSDDIFIDAAIKKIH